ncbi:hypothetical protein [Micromonospora sp. RTGN7]|uniref:hypothetical protein n=1 Tax=Micromonospora sp. RTGN7 TaxID=3016526 RepID=UPI0029FF0684|nr:hypothetical protein [Micromonospora sp. RTGN7]
MKRLWTPAWIARHVAMVALVVGFLGLGWWQVTRAAGGNSTSWGYAVEWPVFAAFVGYVWWRELRHTLRSPVDGEPVRDGQASDGPAGEAVATTPTGVRRPVRVARVPVVPVGGAEDDDLTAYNRYLAWLNANPGSRPGDYPG